MKAKSVDRGAARKGKQDVRAAGPAAFKARFALQRVAQGLLNGETGVTRNGKTRPRFDVVTCHRAMQGEVANVYRQANGQGARFGGLLTCGSVWHCPVCAARIAEQRRLELQLGIRRWSEQGGRVYLMTLTAPHALDLALGDFLASWKVALKRFKACKTYRRVFKAHGRAGAVRSLEVTYGANGWHPHTHDLIFAAPGLLDDYRALEELRHEWVRILIGAGLGDSSKRNDMLKHAFDLQGGDYAAEYVAKFGRQPAAEGWGISDEVTRSHSKVGARYGHLTPFALLEAYRRGDTKAGELFREYAREFEGQRMLYWSPGLKGQLDIRDATDEDLARDPLPEEESVCQLDAEQWRLVIAREARGELLFWAAGYGEPGVLAFLDELRARPPTHRADFGTLQVRRWT